MVCLNFEKNQIKTTNKITAANIVINKCRCMIVFLNKKAVAITNKLYNVRIQVVCRCVNSYFKNWWCRWFLSAKKGLRPEIPLTTKTLSVSKKGKANILNCQQKYLFSENSMKLIWLVIKHISNKIIFVILITAKCNLQL